MTVINLEEYRKPKVGEWAISARYGLRRVSEISDCGWWYTFEGEKTSVNKPSVRKATNQEIGSNS